MHELAEAPASRAAWDAALDPANQLWATRAPVKITVVGNPEEQPALPEGVRQKERRPRVRKAREEIVFRTG